MPFIPHNAADVREMLDTIGVDSIDQLFDEIPESLRVEKLEDTPEAVGEMEIKRLMRQRAHQDGFPLCFIGAGAYEHHIPAAVWEITTRGEFYTAYTPYQAEASQGTLQLIYEYQTMIASLTGMDVSNASLYDGASAVAEAGLMAVRANRRSKSARILVAAAANPTYIEVADAITGNQGLVFEPLRFEEETGLTDSDCLAAYEDDDITALVNPISLALLKPPGEWGAEGADITCGEGQPLGVPLSSGGPYFGLLACKQALVRQMPGRIVGRTVDLDERTGYVLTLQAREQHIRRSKATSNICTNQGLMVTAATIHMSLLGAEGLRRVAAACVNNTAMLVERLAQQEGVSVPFSGPRFHEAVIQLDRPVAPVLDALAEQNILGGFNLSESFPDLGHALLVCATETRTNEDIDAYADALGAILKKAQVA